MLRVLLASPQENLHLFGIEVTRIQNDIQIFWWNIIRFHEPSSALKKVLTFIIVHLTVICNDIFIRFKSFLVGDDAKQAFF